MTKQPQQNGLECPPEVNEYGWLTSGSPLPPPPPYRGFSLSPRSAKKSLSFAWYFCTSWYAMLHSSLASQRASIEGPMASQDTGGSSSGSVIVDGLAFSGGRR